LLLCKMAESQNVVTIFGKVHDSGNKPLEFVNVFVENTGDGATTNLRGEYNFKTSKKDSLKISFSSTGFETKTITIAANKSYLECNATLNQNVTEINEVTIQDHRQRNTNVVRIDPKLIESLPDISGGSIESLLKTMPGVSSNNELSSQYSVRGGNFDENLVYVNDIEIYRPMLIRSGQQEGLSFANPDMVSSILFSSGGFEAKYDDKMSSVLDIKYKKPSTFGSSVSLSLLGASGHVEGVAAKGKFLYLAGLRYKTSQYMLSTLQTEGEYRPQYTDFQTFLTYNITNSWEINFLGSLAQNKYLFIPESRSTTFGTYQNAINLKIYFEGQELDKYLTYTGAFVANYHPNKNLQLKFIASSYQTKEEETFDILGEYYLNEVNNVLGGGGLGDSTLNLGIGGYLNHARNTLNSTVTNFSHKGLYSFNNQSFQWGVKLQNQIVDDYVNEWKLIDSAGYSIPRNTWAYFDMQGNPMNHDEWLQLPVSERDSVLAVPLKENVYADNSLNTNRISAFIQDSYSQQFQRGEMNLTAGLRGMFWDYNNEFLLSPRLSISWKPKWKTDVVFRYSTGIYYQPAFFKEMRGLDGKLDDNPKSQKSVHQVLAADLNFKAWNRPFKLVAELYYKNLNRLVPYEVDNVRIRYYTKQQSVGYVRGVDLRINGEFVKDAESWASLSIMQTREDIAGDTRGYIPRPTDQLVNFGLFFQDYLRGNKSYKMHLSGIFGSRLPVSAPNQEYRNASFRMPPYRRVDIGFSKVIVDESNRPKSKFLNSFKSLWLSAEIFNLLDVSNTVSYLWVSVIPSQDNLAVYPQYGVPNYLTSRRINIKIQAKF